MTMAMYSDNKVLGNNASNNNVSSNGVSSNSVSSNNVSSNSVSSNGISANGVSSNSVSSNNVSDDIFPVNKVIPMTSSDFYLYSSFPYSCSVYRDKYGYPAVKYRCSDALFFKLLDCVWINGLKTPEAYEQFCDVLSQRINLYDNFEENEDLSSVYQDGLTFNLWYNPNNPFDGGTGLYYLLSENFISSLLSHAFFTLDTEIADSFWYLYELFKIRNSISYLENLLWECKRDFNAFRAGWDSGIHQAKFIDYYHLADFDNYLSVHNQSDIASLFGKEKDSPSYLIFIYGLKYCNLLNLIQEYKFRLNMINQEYQREIHILEK
jgi:hypothetical protein